MSDGPTFELAGFKVDDDGSEHPVVLTLEKGPDHITRVLAVRPAEDDAA